MADKLTQLVVDALSRAAADPAGVPLYASRAEPGLFPATSAAKPAAKRCLDDGLLQLVPGGKREVCRITEKGTQFLLEQASPKQVLEDIARVLEARQAQSDELLATAKQMADGIAGLKATLAAVLPRVAGERVHLPSPRWGEGPGVRGGTPSHAKALPLTPHPSPQRGEGNRTNGTATLAPPATDLPAALLAHLGEWAAAAEAAQDCPLPELFRGVSPAVPGLTVGAFHDALRDLHAAGRVYLHPWTGPLYALPDPTFALLVGHNVAYYASTRS